MTIETHAVLGAAGPVGTELARQLTDQGVRVRAGSRSARSTMAGVESLVVDARSADQVAGLCEGAEVVYLCVGIPYPEWHRNFPGIVAGAIAGAERTGARLVFADNLYAYGPVEGKLTESLPPTTYGRKPALRGRLALEVLEAHRIGRIRAAIVRASDFYGPGVKNAMLGERVFPALLAGKRVQLIGDPTLPHTYTYVPDFARALITAARSDEALGHIWHVPNAPTISTIQVLELAAKIAGTPLRVSTAPGWLLGAMALVSPVMRELKEMTYQWNRPFEVDHSRFGEAYWNDATPFDEGITATLDWYRSQS